MPDKRVVSVVGATGRQGGAVARRLLQDGFAVRALTRHPESAGALKALGAEIVQADALHEDSLRRAFAGSQAVFGVTDFWEHGFDKELRAGLSIVAAARDAGVEQLVFSSVGGADSTRGLGIAHFDAKREIEAAVRGSGLRWTILQPATFLENIVGPRFRRAICTRGVLQFGFNRIRRFQFVAMQDLAHFAALAFAGDAWIAGRTIEIASDACTMDELATIVGNAAGRPVKYIFLTPAVQRAISLFIALSGRQAVYKAGPSLIAQFRWNNESPVGGWAADLPALRAIHPGLLTIQEWARTIDWWQGLSRPPSP